MLSEQDQWHQGPSHVSLPQPPAEISPSHCSVLVKSRYPFDSLAPVAALHGFGTSGAAFGGGERAVFFGGVMSGGVDPDDAPVD